MLLFLIFDNFCSETFVYIIDINFEIMHKKLFSFFIITAIILLPTFILQNSCIHESQLIEEFDTICYNTQVQPILTNSCGVIGCHDAGSAREGFVATNYQAVINSVEPGDPKKSKLYDVVTNIWAEHFMPPGSPLSKNERNIIQLWILQGALETMCTDTSSSTSTTYPEDTICFKQDIQPIFLSSCATTGCHDAASHAEGYILTDYAHIVSRGISPYNSQNSKIYNVLISNEADDQMPPPPRSRLSNDQIAAIQQWIDEGAINSDCPGKGCDTLSSISYSQHVLPILQDNCISCHNTIPANGGVLLNSYTNIANAINETRNGTSLLLGSIRRENGFISMPQTYSLTDCEIRTIELWVEQGMLNN